MPVWILQDIWEVLNTEKASHRWRAAAGFFVAEGGEISNLDLIIREYKYFYMND